MSNKCIMDNIFKEIYKRIIIHRWELAFIDDSIDDILSGKAIGIKRLKYDFKGRWFADPFILDFNDSNIVLLVEDYSDTDKIGKISRLTIDRNSMTILEVKVILSLPNHLSFPAIFRKEGYFYIYPENSKGGGLWIYEYDDDSGQCIRRGQLSKRLLTDAILTPYFNEDIVFSTEEPNPNGNKLGIYKQKDNHLYDLYGEVVFNENISRNAGDFFEYCGKIYRPAQECNVMYGHAISLQEIIRNGSSFEFKEIRRILPPAGAFGIHTFNTFQGLTVIDMKIFRYPWIAKPLFTLRNWLSFALKHK